MGGELGLYSETVLQISLDWAFLGFLFLLTDQCSKHEFVTEACVGWKGRDTGNALLGWEEDWKYSIGLIRKDSVGNPSELTCFPAYSRNSKTHRDIILLSFHYSPVEHLSDCAVKCVAIERFFPAH